MLVRATDIEGLRTRDLSWDAAADCGRATNAYSTAFYYSQQMPLGAESTQIRAVLRDRNGPGVTFDDLLAPSSADTHVQLGAGPPACRRGIRRGIGSLPGGYRSTGRHSCNCERKRAVLVVSRPMFRPPALRTARRQHRARLRIRKPGPREGDARSRPLLRPRHAEITHWLAPAVGLATFIDAGNAPDEPRGLKPSMVTASVRACAPPIVPFRVDVAYARRPSKCGCTFLYGLTF